MSIGMYIYMHVDMCRDMHMKIVMYIDSRVACESTGIKAVGS